MVSPCALVTLCIRETTVVVNSIWYDDWDVELSDRRRNGTAATHHVTRSTRSRPRTNEMGDTQNDA